MGRIGSTAFCALLVVSMLQLQDNFPRGVHGLEPSIADYPSDSGAVALAESAASLPARARDAAWELPEAIADPFMAGQGSSPVSERVEVLKPVVAAPVSLQPAVLSGDYPELSLTRRYPAARWSHLLEDNTGCAAGSAANCPLGVASSFPPAPPGYSWKPLAEKFTFSAYALPGEDVYMGDLVDIPGILGLQAKEEFLFSVSGIAMQGGGTIRRLDDDRIMRSIYIKYIAGTWVLEGRDVYVTDQWYYSDTGEIVPLELIPYIRIGEPRFSILPEPELIPYYSVAASNRFPIGTKIFVPELQGYGGVFEVQDRGGAFVRDSLRFDIFVGRSMDRALEWFRMDTARHNLTVYVLTDQS